MMARDRMLFRQRQFNGNGLSMNGEGFHDDIGYYDPSQPLVRQQYYQRHGPSDFRQASRYTLPRIREESGHDDSAYTTPYKDDNGLGEKCLFPLRKNGSVDGFGWRRGRSELFREPVSGMAGYDDNPYYDPTQPLFAQQYYQRQGSSEDFEKASRYTLPRNRQALGDCGSSYTASYKDDSGLREKRLRGYRMSGSVNDFGWRRDLSENFRQEGRGMTGSSTGGFGYGGDIRGAGGRRNYTPTEREMRQQRIDPDEYEDNMYQGRGSNLIRDFRLGSPTSSINGFQDRSIRGGTSKRNDFRQGDSTWNNLRERGSRQLLDNRQVGRRGGYDRGIDSRDDYYNNNMRYYDDDRRSMNGSGGYGYDSREDDRWMIKLRGIHL
jgi:hypothetical protein